MLSTNLNKSIQDLFADSLRATEHQLHLREAVLDASDRDFSPVMTDVGNLLLKVESAEPFLDGYKLLLGIGNPHAMTITGGSVQVFWANTNKEFSISQELLPGKWTDVPLAITRANPQDLHNIKVSVNVKAVGLSKA